MKKVHLLVLALLLVCALLFSACDYINTPSNANTEPSVSETDDSDDAPDMPTNANTEPNGNETNKPGTTPSFSPDYSAGQANTVGSENGNFCYTSQADWIYFSPSLTQISKFQKNSSSIVSVYNVPSGVIRCVNVVGDWIYFYVEGTSTANSYIAKVRTDGSLFEKILSSVTVGEMLVVKDTVFFTIIKNPYSNYAKDCAPLYSISVNGGVTKQLHDGYVSSITADATYVYFLQTLETGASSIYRIKHDGTKETQIYKNANIHYFVLSNANLYFLTSDRYSDVYTIASIPANGRSQTTYGKIPFYSEWLYVSGNKAYYFGSPYRANEAVETVGIVAFDISTKSYRVIKETFEDSMCFFASNYLILEQYSGETLRSVSLYNTQTNTWRSVSVK